jgi:sarcosine oxidase subunit gamma
MRLIAKTAFDGRLPRRVGNLDLSEPDLGQLTSVAPFRGQEGAVSARLGLAWPAPGEVTTGGGLTALWVGPGRALIMGGAVQDLGGLAAVTDQSDSAAVMRVSGADGPLVLARLVPVDLRPTALPPGRTLRSLVGHMTASITRTGADEVEIMVFRSMALTLLDEVCEAAEMVAARGAA